MQVLKKKKKKKNASLKMLQPAVWLLDAGHQIGNLRYKFISLFALIFPSLHGNQNGCSLDHSIVK